MRVSLREVTAENWQQVCGLRVADDQEVCVAQNWHSLLYAVYGFTGELADLVLVPLAVYADEQVVGLVMYNTSSERDRFFIMRLMIDHTVQRRGYGRAALEHLIAHFKAYPRAKEVAVGYIPGNHTAEGLYRRLDFVETGLDEEGKEMIAVMDLNPQHEPWESPWRKS